MAGRAPAGAMAASVARRHQLGYRADDAGSRTARFAVLVQAEENLEGEAAHRPVLGRQDWLEAGAGWEGLSSELQLTGWSQARRVVILRRRLREALALGEEDKTTGQRVF